MTSTLDAALDALKREVFYSQMAEAESRLQADPKEWNAFIQERDEWLEAPLESS